MAEDSQFSRRSFLVRAGVMTAALALLDVEGLPDVSSAGASTVPMTRGSVGSVLLRRQEAAAGLGDLAPIFGHLSPLAGIQHR